MTLFKHNKYVQKEFQRLDDMLYYEPLKKPIKKEKYYTGSFIDKDGKVITIINGQIKEVK